MVVRGPDGSETVHECFAQQASTTPDAVALVAPGRSAVSYAELDSWANRVARAVADRGVARGDVVGVRVHRSVECVVAMLGVLKAGAAYLPLEAGLPDERLRSMAVECDVRLVITAAPLTWGWSPVLSLDAVETGQTASAPLDVPVGGEDLMYIPFTSGSTGRPKGTLVPHRGVHGFFNGVDYARWGPGRVSLLHSALSWDAHLLELYPSLLSGGRVVVLPGAVGDPIEVAVAARDHEVDVLFLTPAAFNTVVDVDPTLLVGVDDLLIGGDVLSSVHLRRARAALPNTRMVNAYGPSECTVITACHVVSDGDLIRTAVPIGKPIGDRRVYLLDAGGVPIADGTPGELCVGGPAVAHGYLGRPRTTAERFTPDPFSRTPGARLYRSGDTALRNRDGTLEFLGRSDGQLKIRGFRVELAEIEAVLREHPQVADAAVKPDTAGGDTRLTAYLVTGSPVPSAADLRTWLRRWLPDHMVPTAYFGVERLPITHAGKLDRQALPAAADCVPLQPATDDQHMPVSDLQRWIARVWGRVLNVPEPSLSASFFDLGGHSLSAARILFTLREELRLDLSLGLLFESEDLEAFCARVAAELDLAGAHPDVTALLRDTRSVHPPAPDIPDHAPRIREEMRMTEQRATDSDHEAFQVVRNDEEQYSIWASYRDPPAGWHGVGVHGSREECLAYIEQVWTDIRPKSLREALARRDGIR